MVANSARAPSPLNSLDPVDTPLEAGTINVPPSWKQMMVVGEHVSTLYLHLTMYKGVRS